MKFNNPVHLLFLALVTVDVSEAFKAKELEQEEEIEVEVDVGVGVGMTKGLDSHGHFDVPLLSPDVHAESGDVMHDGPNLIEYADHLSQEPQPTSMSRLSKDKEMALLRRAYLRMQELRKENEEESAILGDINRAVCVIIKKMSFPFVEHNQESTEIRPLMAAQGMEQAVMTLMEISTHPVWLRLGFMAFITMDDFPVIHKLLSEQFKVRHHLDMLHASALKGNMEALKYLSAGRKSRESKLLWSLMEYGCYGGHIKVFEWTLQRLWVDPPIAVINAFSWTATAGQLALFQCLARRYFTFYNTILVKLASLAVKSGKLAILQCVVNSVYEATSVMGPRFLNRGIRTAAAHGNTKMLHYLIKLYQRENLGYPELTEALQNVVAIGSQKGLKFLLGLPWFVDNLYQKSPEWLSMLYLLAVQRGHLPIVQFLLAEEIDGTRRFPNLCPTYHVEFSQESDFMVHGPNDRPQIDAMILAARWGHSKIVEYLLVMKESGKEAFQPIDPTAENYLALSQAILFKHESIIDMLFKFVDSRAVSSRIFEACGNSGNLKILKALAEMGLFTEASSELPVTLSRACSQGSLEVVTYILEDLLKFNLTPVVKDMEMNLLIAVKAGKLNVVQYLLQRKPDGGLLFQGIDLATCSTTLFEHAVCKCYEPIVNFLLSNVREHIDISIVDTIPSVYYSDHHIFRVIIKERYGPCPYPVGSTLEECWLKWMALWHYGWI